MINDKQNDKEERAKSILEGYAKDWKIFIDTCSILHSAADMFWNNIIPLLQKYNNKVIVTARCAEELKRLADNPDPAKPDHKKAGPCLKLLKSLENKGLVEFRGEPSDSFADNLFLTVFTKFRTKYKLLLVTQDGNLAEEINNLNNSKSVRCCPVNAKRINRFGFLSSFNPNINNNRTDDKASNRSAEQSRGETVDEKEVFRICTTVTSEADAVYNVKHVPGERDFVYYMKIDGRTGSPVLEPIQLIKKVAAGGEGIIYAADFNGTDKYVAKIYGKGRITRRRWEKIKLWHSKPINCEGICSPIKLLYNSHKEFVGFLMPKAAGITLQRSVFIKALLQKYFPDWKKRDTVELCITILQKIKYLHDRHIIMGDINPNNILVVSPKEVYFVDTDSYQIEDFPCPVGTIPYTAPEIQRKDFNTFLRTMGNENFAVATLLFMIMLPGKTPYAQQGGEDMITKIVNMDFSYPLGADSNKKTPEGLWRYMWSHLTYELKEAFYNTFRKGGKYSAENSRLTADDWLRLFNNYLHLLDSGKLGERDKMSEELFPTRFKKSSQSEKVCELICVDCGQKFEITESEAASYRDRGHKPPKRCKNCREAKKERAQDNNLSKPLESSMKICPSCHAQCPSDRRLCEACGHSFPENNAARKSAGGSFWDQLFS